jgi:hypothetical protein
MSAPTPWCMEEVELRDIALRLREPFAISSGSRSWTAWSIQPGARGSGLCPTGDVTVRGEHHRR